MTTELPKVQGYLPQAVFNHLLAYKKQHNIKSVSLAVTQALTEFFGVSESPENHSESLPERVGSLEGK